MRGSVPYAGQAVNMKLAEPGHWWSISVKSLVTMPQGPYPLPQTVLDAHDPVGISPAVCATWCI